MGLAKALGWFKHKHEQHFSVNNSYMNDCKCDGNTLYMLMSAYSSYYNKRELSHKILYANLNSSYNLLVPSTSFRRQSKLTHMFSHLY